MALTYMYVDKLVHVRVKFLPLLGFKIIIKTTRM